MRTHSDTLVIIPTYNERLTLPFVVGQLDKLGFDVLIVDDNSPDKTADWVKEAKHDKPWLHLWERPQKAGLGTAYVAGFRWALARSYKHVAQMTANMSHSPEEIERMLEYLRKNEAAVVVGSRYLDGIRVINWPLQQLALNMFGGWYARFWTGLELTDPTSGLTVISRNVLEKLPLLRLHATGYVFQIEFNYWAYLLGFDIQEVPIIFYDRWGGVSKIKWCDVLEAAWQIPFLRLQHAVSSN